MENSTSSINNYDKQISENNATISKNSAKKESLEDRVTKLKELKQLIIDQRVSTVYMGSVADMVEPETGTTANINLSCMKKDKNVASNKSLSKTNMAVSKIYLGALNEIEEEIAKANSSIANLNDSIDNCRAVNNHLEFLKIDLQSEVTNNG